MAIKTLHLTNSWHPHSGGIRTFYLALMDAANAAGRPMHPVVPSSEERTERVGGLGVIHQVKCPLAPGSDAYRMIYPHQYMWPGGRVNRILRELRPDVVEFADKYTLNYMGGLLRVGMVPGVDFRPVVVGLSCERFSDSVRNYMSDGPASRWLAKLYLRWLYFPLADQHIAVSKFVASELEAVSSGHKVERAVWLGPMGVDYDTFRSIARDTALRAQLLRNAGAGAGTPLFIYAGRLAREKNVPLLIHTLAELRRRRVAPEARLLVAGSGGLLTDLEDLARRVAPGAVTFLGHQSKADLVRIFSVCDAFLHANAQEPFGIGPLEAMAAGLPLVAPNSGGVCDYANPGNAWLAQPTPACFADAIEQIVLQPTERAAKVERARATAAANKWPEACQRFLELYDAMFSARKSTEYSSKLSPMFRSTT